MNCHLQHEYAVIICMCVCVYFSIVKLKHNHFHKKDITYNVRHYIRHNQKPHPRPDQYCVEMFSTLLLMFVCSGFFFIKWIWKCSWHRPGVTMVSVHLHYSSVIIALVGWSDISASASSLKQRGIFTHWLWWKMPLHHKEGSHSWIINQIHLGGCTTYHEGDVMLGDWLGWCHWGGWCNLYFNYMCHNAAEWLPV